MVLWEFIYKILLESEASLTKQEIADAILCNHRFYTSPETVRNTINNQWAKGNFAIYAESCKKSYRYNASPEYYKSFTEGHPGI